MEQVTLMTQDPAVSIIEASVSEQLAPDVMQAAGLQIPELFDLTIMRKQRGCVKLRNVPPSDFLVNRTAKTMEEARLLGEWVTYTRSQLKEMGISDVDEIKSYDGASNLLEEDERTSLPNDSADKSLEEVRLFEGFIRCDYNGDGVAEWRRILASGDRELENEEVEGHEYAVLTPIKLPHRVIGMALADPVTELQRLSSGLTRQYVDSLYLANNPRTYVNQKAVVNLDDVISNRIGGIIRGEGPAQDAVSPIKTALVATESLAGIEMTQGMRERRTGVTRYNQGLDADSLNKTATGITKITNMADRRMLLILRMFAESGVKDLFKLVLRLITQYQDIPLTIRLRNEFVQFDPRMWSPDMDVSTDVGLGTGDKTETLVVLQQFGQFMQQAATVGMVGPEQIYEFGKALAKNAKLKGAAEKFLIPPDKIQQKPPQPSPEQIKAQMEQTKYQHLQQMEIIKLQAEAAVARDILEQARMQPAASQIFNPGGVPATARTAQQMRATDPLPGDAMSAIDRARQATRAAYGFEDSSPLVRSALSDGATADPARLAQRFIINGTPDEAAQVARNLTPEGRHVVRDALATHIKRKALGGSADEVGKVSQKALNSALSSLGPEKLGLFFSPEDIQQLQRIGRVASYTQAQPAGSAVNNSNSGALVVGKGLNALMGITSRIPLLNIDQQADALVSMGRTANALRANRGLLAPQVPEYGLLSNAGRGATMGGLLAIPKDSESSKDNKRK